MLLERVATPGCRTYNICVKKLAALGNQACALSRHERHEDEAGKQGSGETTENVICHCAGLGQGQWVGNGRSSVGREAAGRASVSMDVMLDGQSVYWVMWYSSSGWWYRVVALVHWNGQAAHGLGRRSLPAALLAAKHAQQPFLLAGRSEACRLREWGAEHAFST